MGKIEKIGRHFYRVLRDGNPSEQPEPDHDKAKFIAEHRGEIAPLVGKEAVDEAIANPTEEKLNGLLERFETRVLTWKREDAKPGSKKILLEASQPANVPIIAQLIEHLRADSRCAQITLLTDNVAGQQLEKTAGMTTVRSDNKPVLADITEGPYDTALIMDEAPNSPMPLLRESAKSIFGASSLLYYCPGVAAEATLNNAFPDSKWDTVDTLLVADDLSRTIITHAFQVPESRVAVAGSPVIEAIRDKDADIQRTQGREKLQIPKDFIVGAYIGFPSSDRGAGTETFLNTKTFLEVAEGVIQTARANPDKNYALIVRTHPRARAVEPLPDVSNTLPPNLTIINGDTVSYDDVVYATDVICCLPTSTEAVYGYYRGRSVALCAFEGKGAAGEIAREDYGANGLQVFEKTGRGIPMVTSADLAPLLENARPLGKPTTKDTHMIERIKSLLLETESIT